MTYHFMTDAISFNEQRARLNIQEWKGAAVEVKVNGHVAGVIGWKGRDGLDVTDFLEEKNNIDIAVITTPRNLFGPFHQKYETGIRSSFKDFRTVHENYTDQYRLIPQGLMKTVIIQSE